MLRRSTGMHRQYRIPVSGCDESKTGIERFRGGPAAKVASTTRYRAIQWYVEPPGLKTTGQILWPQGTRYAARGLVQVSKRNAWTIISTKTKVRAENRLGAGQDLDNWKPSLPRQALGIGNFVKSYDGKPVASKVMTVRQCCISSTLHRDIIQATLGQSIQLFRSLNASEAACTVCAMSSSVCTADTNIASNWLHGRYMPRLSIP